MSTPRLLSLPWSGVVALAACLCSSGASGSIVFRDIPDITLEADWNVIYGEVTAPLDADDDGAADFNLRVFWSRYGGWIQYGTSVATLQGAATLNAGLTDPRRLADGSAIGPESFTWSSGGQLRGYGGEVEVGQWTGAGYLAFRLTEGADARYGWVSMYATGQTIRVFSLAYESEVNTPIAAGAVPGPGASTLLACSLASAGLALRRREGRA